MDHEVLVYKVDNPIQNSLLSSLVLTLIQGSIYYWSTLQSLSHNIQGLRKLYYSFGLHFLVPFFVFLD